MLNVLLTNDDGIEAAGLQALRQALVALPDVRLAVIAPDGNRSATARSITTRRPLSVQEVVFDDATVGYATDGTPVDCVRLANLGLIEGFAADIVVSGVNHGANLGDDITYSGTVAAALEGLVLGVGGIAVSQQCAGGNMGYRPDGGFSFEAACGLVVRLIERVDDIALPPQTMLNVNVPAGAPRGVAVTTLGKRIYADRLELDHDQGAVFADDARGGPTQRYWIYGDSAGFVEEPGTDLAAIADGLVAITPIHFDLTHRPAIEQLLSCELGELLAFDSDAAIADVASAGQA